MNESCQPSCRHGRGRTRAQLRPRCHATCRSFLANVLRSKVCKKSIPLRVSILKWEGEKVAHMQVYVSQPQ